MRVSVLRDDPGFIPRAFSREIDILLDGRKIKRCVTADTKTGEVVVWSHASSMGVLRKTFWGDVEIVLNFNNSYLTTLFYEWLRSEGREICLTKK